MSEQQQQQQGQQWRVTLFGGLRAERGGQHAGQQQQVITRFRTQKVASLFAYLAYHLRQAHSREVLIEMLWPGSDAPAQRNGLSVALSSLRHQFEPPGTPQGAVIRADRFSVGLNPASVTTDVLQFEQAIKAAARAESLTERAQRLTEAVELYGGALLPGFYEEWITGEQERLSGLFFDAVGALIGHLESMGDTRVALAHARHAVAVDPFREEGQQHLIRLLAADNQPGAALRQYKEYERLLEEETAEEPSSTLRALFRRIEKDTGLSAPTPAVLSTVPTRRLAGAGPFAGAGSASVSSGTPATMSFLMCDIEGSTRLFQRVPEAYTAARERHHALLRREFARHGGQEVKETGDGFVAAFPTAGSALACAVACQQALAQEPWPEEIGVLKVRMALHTGDVDQQRQEDGSGYHGIVLHHASRMLTAAHGGQVLVSEVTAALVRRELETGSDIRLADLGVYRLRDVPTPERLFQVEWPQMAQAQFAPLAAEAGHRANLPPRFTRFFGREQEIGALREMLLLPEVRLVTVTGPGGNGKSRLSLEAAERLAEPFAGAVYFVSLADLSDAALIPGAVLDALAVPRSAQKEPLEQAAEVLAGQPTLLVLDNFEQLIEVGGPEVVQTLLSRVPSLTLLVTSRQLLGLSAEREFVLSPLPIPGGEETPEQLSLYESVQLFIDRAQQVMPYFQVTNANAAAVAALVGGLEGIPLAIELAAARVQVLTPAQMLAQLGHRFDFLASRKRDVAERQRTLRGALEWSYRLLSPELQRFFARLSVFRGGWSVEASEAVCEEPLAMDYLEMLRECSLVLPGGDRERGSVRFRMLETLREYGMERLAERREVVPLRLRHLAYFLTLGEEAASLLMGPEQGEGLARIEADYDNLNSALDLCLETAGPEGAAADVQQGLRLASVLQWFWQARGHWSEGRERLLSVLSHPRSQARTKERAETLNGIGLLAWHQNDYPSARRYFDESLSIREEIGERKDVAGSLVNLGNLAAEQGDFETARSLYEQSLPITRETGHRVWEGMCLLNLGNVSGELGDYEAAESYMEQSLTLRREIGHREGIANSLDSLGVLASGRGELAKARAYLEEALALQRELGLKGRTGTLISLGDLARQTGDLNAARALLSESISLCRELGGQRSLAFALEGFAHLAQAEGRNERAVRHFGAADALREKLGTPRGSTDSVETDRALADLRAALGEDVFTRDWEAGRAMDADEAAAYALT